MPGINQCTFLFRTSDFVDFSDDPDDDMQTKTGMLCYKEDRRLKGGNGRSIERICKYHSVSVFDKKKKKHTQEMSFVL